MPTELTIDVPRRCDLVVAGDSNPGVALWPIKHGERSITYRAKIPDGYSGTVEVRGDGAKVLEIREVRK